MYEVVEDEAKENLKEVLTPDEYESIFDSGKYEIKLKNKRQDRKILPAVSFLLHFIFIIDPVNQF